MLNGREKAALGAAWVCACLPGCQARARSGCERGECYTDAKRQWSAQHVVTCEGLANGGPQWTSGSGRGYAVSAFEGVKSYASSAGFGVVFTGGKPCETEKNFNPGADLRSAARKLIRSSTVVTPARCDVDIKLGRSNSTNRVSCL